VALTDVKQIGPEYECGFSSPSYGLLGAFIKPNTFRKELQTQLRDDVIASLTQIVADRDVAFWKRISQHDWSLGDGQEYFTNVSRYKSATGLDVHTPGVVRVVPQPSQLRAATGNLNGKGSAYGAATLFFPSEDGFYAYVLPNLTVNRAATKNVDDRIGGIVCDGTNVFFTTYAGTSSGISTTTAAAPGTLTQYDTLGFLHYHAIAYDQAKKILYAALTGAGGEVDKINAGAGPTIIYGFVTGRVDALEMYQGNLIIGWNDAPTTGLSENGVGVYGRSRLFKWDGSTLSTFFDFPDGSFIIGLKSAFGLLFVTVLEQDPLDSSNRSVPVKGVYVVSGSTLTRLSSFDATVAFDPGSSGIYIGGGTAMLDVGQHLFISGSGHVNRYDIQLGGLSRSLGDEGIPGIAGFTTAYMSSLGMFANKGLICMFGGGQGVAGSAGHYALNGTINGLVPASAGTGTCKLTSSRIDAGLPYVNKFWFAIEVLLGAALNAGESITMEYSLDDGATWTASPQSPFNTMAVTTAVFQVLAVNPHIRYRVGLFAAAAGSKGPVVDAVTVRFAVVNQIASVYRMTLQCFDQIRGRGNKVDDPGYGKTALTFFDNIARKPELVTFYEPDDSARTPHTCWVWQLFRPMTNTGSAYSPQKQEGEVELVLWEAVN